MSRPTADTAAPPKREFAFSRIAGASPSDYAAVSSLAVWSLLIALLSVAGWVWLWALAAPVLAVALAALAWYRIATSAGTLTGKPVAIAAIVTAVALGGASAGRQWVAYRDQQLHETMVRQLGQQACQLVAAGRFDELYDHLGPHYRERLPLGYWRYQWRRFFETRGQPVRVELSPRTVFLPHDQILLTMNITLPDPYAEPGEPQTRVTPVRLLYGPPGEAPVNTDPMAGEVGQMLEPEADAHRQHSDDGHSHQWQLLSLPQFMTELPEPYIEPLVWPQRGPLLVLVYRADGRPEGRIVEPGEAMPTTQPGERIEVMALSPVVPPAIQIELGPWLPQPRPRPQRAHQH